jgi:hypothetical protein
MAKRGSLAATLAVLALLGLGVAACGDESGSSATSPPADGGAQANETSGGRSGGGGRDGSATTPPAKREADAGEADDAIPTTRDSGGDVEQFVTPGGDNSVQEFGEEAGESEFEEAAAALHTFLDARAEGDWETTCEYLSSNVLESLGRFAAQAKQLSGKGCPELLGSVSGPATEDARKEAAIADVGAMRIEGERAYLLYRGAAKTNYAIPMAKEDDGWKVDAMGGVPLS